MTAASKKSLPGEVAGQGYFRFAERVSCDARPMSVGKKKASAPTGEGGVWVQAPTHGVQGQSREGPSVSRDWRQPAKTAGMREIIGQRRWMVWCMSPYERKRRSNVFRGVVVRHFGQVPGKGALGTRRRYEASRLQTRCWNLEPRTARVYSNQLGERGVRAGA
jgi:hypothetical protein